MFRIISSYSAFLLFILLSWLPFVEAYDDTAEHFQRELLKGSDNSLVIVRSQLSESEADTIVDFLASKKVTAFKQHSKSDQLTELSDNFWEVYVASSDAAEAIIAIDEEGLPVREKSLVFEEYMRRQRERFQDMERDSQVVEVIRNKVKKIAGVIEVEVLYRNNDEEVYATIYVRHNGSLDDPSSELAEKIKKIVLVNIPNLKEKNLKLITERDIPGTYQLPDLYDSKI
ncbi:MAG: hypothetical protein VX777_02895 [Chlamydiota bacterium]|nr:hypothetical protein [Chlamydiota bacterium]